MVFNSKLFAARFQGIWNIDENDGNPPKISVHVGAKHIISRGEIAGFADEISIAVEANAEVAFTQTSAFTVWSTARWATDPEE